MCDGKRILLVSVSIYRALWYIQLITIKQVFFVQAAQKNSYEKVIDAY